MVKRIAVLGSGMHTLNAKLVAALKNSAGMEIVEVQPKNRYTQLGPITEPREAKLDMPYPTSDMYSKKRKRKW